MLTITSKHLSDLKLLLGTQTKSIKARMPKLGDAYEKRIAGLQEKMQQNFEKLEAIRVSGRYSEEGEQAEKILLVRAVRENHFVPFKAETIDKLNAQMAEQRAAALKPKAQITDPLLLLRKELRDREYRDHLRTLDPLTLQARIRQAVDDGAGLDLLDALEGAPAGFPIAPPELVQEARVRIAEKNHPELGELAQLRDAYSFALGVVDQALVAASGLNPVEISTNPAPTGSTQRPYIVGTGQQV